MSDNPSPKEEIGCATIILASAISIVLLIWALSGFPVIWR